MKKRNVGQLLWILNFFVLIYAIYKNSTILRKLYEMTKQYKYAMRWISFVECENSLDEYLLSRGYKNIGIYGIGIIGKSLFRQLVEEHTGIRVCALVDRKHGYNIGGLEVTSPNNFIENIDLLIVTPIVEYEEIKENMDKKTNADIMSLEDILITIEKS